MTEDEKQKIYKGMLQFMTQANVTIVPDNEYQEALREGTLVVCAPYNAVQAAESRELFSDRINAILKGICTFCKTEVMYGEINKAATYLVCIQCFIKYNKEIIKDLKGEAS